MGRGLGIRASVDKVREFGSMLVEGVGGARSESARMLVGGGQVGWQAWKLR